MRFEEAFAAAPPAIAEIRAKVVEMARQCELDDRSLGHVALAVSEAATNVIVHAYRHRPGIIRVTAWAEDGDLTIVVADDGPGLIPRADSPGLGLGLAIIGRVARRMEVVNDGAGTEIHMVFPCPARAQSR